MSESSNNSTIDKSKQVKAEISDIEADVAYFDARISLIGQDPDTPYQKAQLKTYKILEQMLQESLVKKKREYKESKK
jgi:hypothetical protein